MGRSERVTESIPPQRGVLDMTTADFRSRGPAARALNLRVTDIEDSGTARRAVRFASDDLDGFRYAPGQDLMVLVDTSGGRIIRRRYTIRRFDEAGYVIEIGMITDDAGPGGWGARCLREGDRGESSWVRT